MSPPLVLPEHCYTMGELPIIVSNSATPVLALAILAAKLKFG